MTSALLLFLAGCSAAATPHRADRLPFIQEREEVNAIFNRHPKVELVRLDILTEMEARKLMIRSEPGEAGKPTGGLRVWTRISSDHVFELTKLRRDLKDSRVLGKAFAVLDYEFPNGGWQTAEQQERFKDWIEVAWVMVSTVPAQ